MILHKFTAPILQEISGKQIFFYEYSPSYFLEFWNCFGSLGESVNIVDDNARNQGEHFLEGRRVVVHGSDWLSEVDLRQVTFVIMSDYHQEAFEKLSWILRKKECRGNVYYFASHETEVELEYRRFYENQPLEDIIIFRSGPHASAYVRGMDFADNARALFEYMLTEGLNEKYKLVWLVKNPSEFSSIVQKYENVYFLSFDWSDSESKEERDVYYKTLCLAKYIFMTDAYGFCRNARKDQVRVQLWHGCGFKTRVNFVRCEKRYEYNVVISEVYRNIHKEIYGLRKEQVLVTGYPKNDWLFHPDAAWREKLGIPKGEYYIFWLPTFRTPVGQLDGLDEKAPEGETGLPVLQSREELQKLDVYLCEKKVVLIVKLHPFQNEGAIGRECLRNMFFLEHGKLVENGMQINQLLGFADGLISDYSSVAVDFLLLDKPVAFTLDDIEDYGNSRGFVFDPLREWLPGNEIYTYSDFVHFIGNAIEGKDEAQEKRRNLTRKMHQYFDNRSSKRVLEALGIGT